jgi:hypothetical protein
MDGDKKKTKCINWVANCDHMTLLRIAGDGRFIVEQVFVEGKAWRHDRHVPQNNLPRTPLSGKGLAEHMKHNFYEMYGIWDEIDNKVKEENESTNQRKNAVNTFNDEEVKISKVLDKSVEKFIDDGNVSPGRRERNKAIRQVIRDKNKIRNSEIRKKIRELKKEKGKQDKRNSNRLNVFGKK